MTTAGSFTMHASAALSVPQTRGQRLPSRGYSRKPHTPNTEKHNDGPSEMNARPKKIADGEMAIRERCAASGRPPP